MKRPTKRKNLRKLFPLDTLSANKRDRAVKSFDAVAASLLNRIVQTNGSGVALSITSGRAPTPAGYEKVNLGVELIGKENRVAGIGFSRRARIEMARRFHPVKEGHYLLFDKSSILAGSPA